MERAGLYLRIAELYSTVEMTIPMVYQVWRSPQPDLRLADELITFQLEVYNEIRLLLEQYAGTDCLLLEKYDALLHQLKTDYLLVACGVSRTHAA